MKNNQNFCFEILTVFCDFYNIILTLNVDWGVSEAGYRAGLSRRRSRVRAPHIPLLIFKKIRDDPLAQLVEQWTVNPCVAGSSPAGVVIKHLTSLVECFFFLESLKNDPLAQLVEQWTVNPCVAGSSPAGVVFGHLTVLVECFFILNRACYENRIF